MSFLNDLLGFESFNLKDMFAKVKKNPERLLLGAADPLSSQMWGGLLGKKYDPIVDQMGGPAADVYGKAQDAGINTGPATGAHNVAHAVAAMYGGQGLMGLGGAAAPASGGGDLGLFSNGGANGLQGVGGGNAGLLASRGVIGGGAGMGASAASGMQFTPQDYMKMAQSMQPQQQPMPPPAPQSAPNNAALMEQMQRQQRAQELRRKTNRTLQENEELRALTQSQPQGLLG